MKEMFGKFNEFQNTQTNISGSNDSFYGLNSNLNID
jgi:hypothetical protein